jgi:CRP-like cAMP-binding protein
MVVMLTVEKVSLLASVEMFARVPSAVLASLAGVMEERSVAAGDVVMTKGEPGDALFVVADGSLRAHAGDRTLATMGPGSVIGELAVLDPAPRAASVTAEEDSLLLVLSKDDFDLVMTDHPELSEGVIRYLVRFVRAGTAPTGPRA